VKEEMSGIKDVLTKTTVANFVAGVAVLAGIGYAIYVRDSELVKNIVVSGLTYLLVTNAVKNNNHS
jgi:hypothetical protein